MAAVAAAAPRWLHASAAAAAGSSAGGGGINLGGNANVSVASGAQDIKRGGEHPYLTQNARYMPGFSYPAPRELSSIVKYALLEREDPETIKQIWQDYHKERSDSVATVLTASEWEQVLDSGRRFPLFVVPVKKGEGKFFTLISQFQDNHCIMTFLDDYQRDPASAEPFVSVTFYTDLAERKGLVLVRTDYSGHLVNDEARHIMERMLHYYGKDTRMVEQFNRQPDRFSFDALLAEF